MGSIFANKNENEVRTWTKLVNRVFVDSSGKKKTFQMSNPPRFV